MFHSVTSYLMALNIKIRIQFFCLILLILGSCKDQCNNPVYFQVSSVFHDSKIVLDLNSSEFSETFNFPEGFTMDLKNRKVLIKEYCSTDSVIRVKYTLNQLDTLFVISTSQIKGCFLGADTHGKPSVFFDYYKGGLREYAFD